MTILLKIWLIEKTKMSANWLLICVIGLILSSKFVSVSATPGDVCTAHSNCDGGEYCYNAGACSLCYDNNVCSIYGNSIDGDCSACTSSSPSASDSSDNAVTNTTSSSGSPKTTPLSMTRSLQPITIMINYYWRC